MGRRSYHRGYHHGYYHGYHRGSRKTDDGTGCLFDIFKFLFLGIFLLILSDNPTAKKFGWGLLAAFALFWALGSSGIDVSTALIVVIIIFVVGAVIAFAISSGGGNSATNFSEPFTENDDVNAISEPPTKNDISVRSVEADDDNAYKNAIVTPLAPKKESVPVAKPVVTPPPVKLPEAPVVQKKEQIMQKQEETIKTKVLHPPELEENPVLCFLKEGEKPSYFASVEDAVNRFSIPKGYRKVMIESLRKTDVKKCPGVIWKDEEKFYVLPLLSNGRYISFKLDTITEIEYKKVPDIDTNTDYMELVKEPIAKEFEELYPEYGFDMDGAYTHNFVIGGNVTVTNTSAKAVFHMLQKGLRVEDEFTLSAKYEDEMKDIYRAYILKLNGVLTFEEYAKIRQEKLDAYRNRETDDAKYNAQIKACKARGMM